MMRSTCIFFVLFVGIVKAFLDEGFDPNAINGFGPGPFNPNAGYSTIAPPSIDGGGSTGGGSGFNPNAGLATTIAPPVPNGFTGWSGSGNFDPNSGTNQATTSSPNGEGGFGNWHWGNSNSESGFRKAAASNSGFGNFGNNYWGFGSGSNSNPATKTSTTGAPATTFPTIHPTTPTARTPIFGVRKTTPMSGVGKKGKKNKGKRRINRAAQIPMIVKLLPALEQFDFRSHIIG